MAQDDSNPVILNEVTACVLGVFPSKDLSITNPPACFYLVVQTAGSFAIPIRFMVGTGKAQDDVNLVPKRHDPSL